jgi:hypothetical protein
VLAGKPISSGKFTVFNGTSTVPMREGPVTDVPTTITLLGDTAISIVSIPQRLTIISGIPQSMVLRI